MTSRSVLLLATLLALVGCEPAVQLKSATLRGAGPTGLAFDAMLSIDNPNVFDVQVRAVRANVKVEDVRGYVPVYATPNTWIPAGRKMIVAVPVVIPWGMVPQIVAATVSQAKVEYTVTGNADITATRAFAIDRDMYEFDQDGEIPRGFFLNVGMGGINLGLGGR